MYRGEGDADCMTLSLAQLQELMDAPEGAHLEFKEARNAFEFDNLVKYCAALANEGGGRMILGVTDRRPRRVVGSQAFREPERTVAGLVQRLHIRVDADVVAHADGRVLVFTVPGRPIGMPIQYEGRYWMRSGEELAPMTPDMLKRIFDEAGPDFSAEICPGAMLDDLDPAAIDEFRVRWHRRAQNDAILQLSPEQLLRDAELVIEGGVTYAALVLLGTHAALGKYLAQAEVVFEYRSSEAAGPANQREEFRRGFLSYYDRLWELVNLRNDRQHYQDGLFMVEVPTFNEAAVREAILNSVSHRDYRHPGSVFVRQFPRRIEIVSPGGFPQGVTPENIVDRQQPRNRRIADAFARCGLVERAGQGANRIFEACVREGKALPDFTQTDAWQVGLTLHGEMQDPRFVRFLERVGRETAVSFGTHELLALDLVHREEPVPLGLRPHVRRLVELGAVESVGRGRGTRYLLSRRFYAALGQPGAYTRQRGLDHEENKAILLQHLRSCGDAGCQISELEQVLPSRSRDQIKRLLGELREEGRARLVGQRRGARWRAEADR
jgi:ATP-dependent DNA helicase RecG